MLDQRQVRQRQLVRHQHAVLRERVLGLLDAEEVAQDAQSHVLQVDDPVAEIAGGHALEGVQVLVDDTFQRRLGNQPVGDGLLHLLREAPILEHHAVGVDDAPVELRQAGGEPAAQALELHSRLGDGAPEALALGLEVIAPALLHEREADRGLEEMHAAMPEPGHGRQPPQPRVGAAASSRLGPLGGLLVGNREGQVCSQHHLTSGSSTLLAT